MATAACVHCQTQLARGMLACPACSTLVHADRLKQLAAEAGEAERAEQWGLARGAWERALALLPSTSQQHAVVQRAITTLDAKIDQVSGGSSFAGSNTGSTVRPTSSSSTSVWRQGAAAVGTAVLLALGKLKFLILGLTKASTFFSMFAFFGVYWAAFGWPLAAGLVLSIYIHEMGHVAELRRIGVASNAPLFVPGVGAFVLLRQRIDDPVTDARIGLAGPLWGLGAGLAAYGIYRITAIPIWGAIAHLTGFINLFNLAPVWQLDGARGFHALARWQRWIVVAAFGTAFLVTHEGLLLLLAAVAIYGAMQPAREQPNRMVLATFVGLIAALSWLAATPVALAMP